MQTIQRTRSKTSKTASGSLDIDSHDPNTVPVLLPTLREPAPKNPEHKERWNKDRYNKLSGIFRIAYGVRPKDLQVKAVIKLIEAKNTFLLAGTGDGKTRIVKLYLKCFTSASKGIVLVLNPLDGLRDNQVGQCFQT